MDGKDIGIANTTEAEGIIGLPSGSPMIPSVYVHR